MLINPIFFYLADVFDALKCIGFIIGFILLCVYLTFTSIESVLDEDMHKQKRTSVIIMVICILVFIFSPSKETTTKMIIASQITEDNVDTAKEVVDYIIEKINEVKGE